MFSPHAGRLLHSSLNYSGQLDVELGDPLDLLAQDRVLLPDGRELLRRLWYFVVVVGVFVVFISAAAAEPWAWRRDENREETARDWKAPSLLPLSSPSPLKRPPPHLGPQLRRLCRRARHRPQVVQHARRRALRLGDGGLQPLQLGARRSGGSDGGRGGGVGVRVCGVWVCVACAACIVSVRC